MRGYKQITKDQHALAAYTGYYAAYFAVSKQPKSLQNILKNIYKDKHIQKHVDTVDIEGFLATKKAFEEKMSKWQQIVQLK